MRSKSVLRLFIASLVVFGALFISGGFLLWSSTPQIFNQLIYNPYPPGILPPNFNSEIARVLREIDVVEARAIARWHSLPPPTRPPVRPGPNPPVLQGSGTESIETLGELMLFDKNMSPGRNQACTSCHMPYAGWSGPIPSVNATIIAYPGTVHFRAGKRTAQRHTYAPFFPVLQFNQEQGLFFGGNFWDSRATGYRLRNPDDLDCLKEFSIAMEVFDRSSKYDPNVDAIVRVEARRLRTKLKQYYEDPGRNDPVLIGRRPGSYVPIFRWLDAEPQKPHQEIGAAVQIGASVAVLPFVNMSPEPEQDYFCDGISEEIINSLTHIAGLKVIARSSAFQFKGMSVDIREVGRRLNADVVIEGSVRKAGGKLRITAHAIQAESGHELWSEVFRRELKNVFTIQEEMARSVAALLRVHPPPARARAHPFAGDLEAYTRYLRARFLIHQQSPETLRAALEQLRELTDAFPDYALAYSGMAAAAGFLSLFGVVSGRDVYPEVKANAERGYALDPRSGETCTVLGALRAWFEHRWDEAQTIYDRALKIQPGHAPAHFFLGMALLCLGKILAAEAALRRSIQLDPLSARDCAPVG